MKAILLRHVLTPLVTRIGTALAAYLLAKGMDGDLTDQLINGLTAVVLVAVDLCTRWLTPDVKEGA
ncbi:hypothetical protein NKJ26_01625 [Mesorhizobium sp. M0152]|uniref:hypothetical protein n=1 Tax=Mesorhizobium sp. M0152 TaxID=2956898 RepID=UPI00333A9000